MGNGAMNRLAELATELPKNPVVRICGLGIAALATVAAGVKAYNEIFQSKQLAAPPAPIPITATTPVTVVLPSPTVQAVPAQEQRADPATTQGCLNEANIALNVPRTMDEALVAYVSIDNEACVRSLLNGGASANAISREVGQGYGMGPALHIALANKRWDVAMLLLERGADPNRRTVYDGSPAQFPGGMLALDFTGASTPAHVREALELKGGKYTSNSK